MKHKIILSAIIWMVANNLYGQSDIAVGTWRTHNSYNSLVSMTVGNSHIFAASNNALFYYDPISKESNIITSLSGLNDSEITIVDYNLELEKLIITYANGNIDILENNTIKNFPDLLTADISGSKVVHHVYNYQNQAYLSADFGVMIIDLTKNQVKETFFELGPTGEKIVVYASTIVADSLYLATELGIMSGSLKDNLKDFSQWNYYGPNDGIPNSPAKVILPSSLGLVVAFENNGVYEFDGNSWSTSGLLLQKQFIHGSQNGGNILLTTTDTVYQYTTTQVNPISTEIGQKPLASIFFNSQNWIADGKNGLIDLVTDNSVYPNGPFSNDIVYLYNFNSSLVALSKAYTTGFQPLRNDDGFFIFNEGLWQNFNSTAFPKTSLTPKFDDITSASFEASSNSLFLSSFGYGILQWEIQKSQFSIYDDSNSPLINSNPSDRNVLVSALGRYNNELIALNFSSPLAIHSLNSGTWQSFNPSTPSAKATQVVNLGNGIYWMKIASVFGGGIKVFDAINQRELYLTTADTTGNLPHNTVYDLSLDREGKMWVATEKGVVYYHNAAFIFDLGVPDPVLPIFDGQVLFKNEKITALEADGGNRIWMATSSGLWLFANDGKENIIHFDAKQSPLPSNNIIDLEINQENGELFIATNNGLVSYRGTSTSAGQLEEIKIFPNPVLANQTDIVTFEGVPENADLWITDSSGRLVFKTKANGNTAVWQGISSSTSSLSSGVYFVFIANEDGSETQIGKVALIF